MDDEIFVEYIRDQDLQVVGVNLDIIDFTILCIAGKEKNTRVFNHLLQTVRELNEESD